MLVRLFNTYHVALTILVAPVIETAMLPELLYAKEGTKTKVMCSVTQGDPPVQISWRKNGLTLPMEKDLTMQNFEDSSILVFRKTSSKHTGNYSCFASNAAAIVNRTTQIIVNGTDSFDKRFSVIMLTKSVCQSKFTEFLLMVVLSVINC